MSTSPMPLSPWMNAETGSTSKWSVVLDFRMAEQVGHGERVAHTLLDEHVAVGAGDADEFDFRAAQRVGDGERVVDAGIEIKNELLHGCTFPR